MKPFIVLLIASLATGPVVAQIYKHIDEQGNVSYSDKPAEDQSNEKVELSPINTTPGMDLEELAKKRLNTTAHFNADYRLSLHSPTTGSHLMAHQRDLSIAASFEVKLRSNSADQNKIDTEKQAATEAASIKIYLNGKLIPSDNGKATVKEITRGEHKIQARLVDSSGKELAPAVNATVFVHRPSRN